MERYEFRERREVHVQGPRSPEGGRAYDQATRSQLRRSLDCVSSSNRGHAGHLETGVDDVFQHRVLSGKNGGMNWGREFWRRCLGLEGWGAVGGRDGG